MGFIHDIKYKLSRVSAQKTYKPVGSDIYSSRLGTNTNRLPLALNISEYFLPLTAKSAPNID